MNKTFQLWIFITGLLLLSPLKGEDKTEKAPEADPLFSPVKHKVHEVTIPLAVREKIALQNSSNKTVREVKNAAPFIKDPDWYDVWDSLDKSVQPKKKLLD